MAAPIFKFKIGNVEGALWDSQYGKNATVTITKRDKEEKFHDVVFKFKEELKTKEGKIKKPFLKQQEVVNLALVFHELAIRMIEDPKKESKDTPDF